MSAPTIITTRPILHCADTWQSHANEGTRVDNIPRCWRPSKRDSGSCNGPTDSPDRSCDWLTGAVKAAADGE